MEKELFFKVFDNKPIWYIIKNFNIISKKQVKKNNDKVIKTLQKFNKNYQRFLKGWSWHNVHRDISERYLFYIKAVLPHIHKGNYWSHEFTPNMLWKIYNYRYYFYVDDDYD